MVARLLVLAAVVLECSAAACASTGRAVPGSVAPGPPAVATTTPAAGPPAVVASPGERVEYHLGQVDRLAREFDRLIQTPCRHFAATAEWQAFLDEQIERATLLGAHLKEASSIARRSGDAELIDRAAEPRRRASDVYVLAAKLEECAQANGTRIDIVTIGHRIQKAVPHRRAEIRLPR